MNTACRQRALLFLAISVFALSVFIISKHQRQRARPIEPAGGEFFENFTAIETPHFLQTDPRWAGDTIGGSDEKLSSAGCTVCCLAMALHAFDVETTPKQLNSFLKDNDGYNFRGWLKWSAVKDFSDGRVMVDRAAPLNHGSIDDSLKRGHPVMAKLLIKNNTVQHWVLIVGKKGSDYLMHDPLGNGAALDPLSKYDSRIFAIRVVRETNRR
jgi:hypothetical protein